MANKPIFIISGMFSEIAVIKDPSKAFNFAKFKMFHVFSHLLVQEKHIQFEILKNWIFIGNFWVKRNDFRLLLPKQNSRFSFRRNAVVKFLIEGPRH